MKFLRRFLPLICLALVVFGCGDMMKGKAIAEPAVKIFHAQFNDENYSVIYAAATDALHKVTPESKLTDLLAAVHRKLGKVVSTTNTGWKANSKNLQTQVVLVQTTVFEHGTGTETFTFSIADGKAKLLGYFINSNDLILK
jgi:hypothetical protein